MDQFFLYPSFYAHIFHAFLILIALFILIVNFKSVMKLDAFKLICIALLFSIAIGIHAISHLGLEVNHAYSPLHILKKSIQ